MFSPHSKTGHEDSRCKEGGRQDDHAVFLQTDRPDYQAGDEHARGTDGLGNAEDGTVCESQDHRAEKCLDKA